MLDFARAYVPGAEGWLMMSVPPQNVKVYDRPERKFSPIIIVVILLVVAIVGFFLYKAMHHDTPTPNAQPGSLLAPAIVRAGVPRSSRDILLLARNPAGEHYEHAVSRW